MSRLPAMAMLSLLGMALFFSWFLPAHHGFWFALDSGIYHAVNHQAVRHPLFADLLAITNNPVFDLCSLLAMGIVYLRYYLRADAAGRRRMLAIGLAMIITALVLNQLGHLVPVTHVSPSRYFKATPGVVSIAELTQIPTKEYSSDSFPGDHGMLLMIFAAFMLHFFDRKGFLQGVLIVLLFSTPRILIGAHWFTDVAVGSLSIVLVGLGLWLPGGGCDALVKRLERYLPRPYECSHTRCRSAPASISPNAADYFRHVILCKLTNNYIIKSYKITTKNPRFPLFITVTSNSLDVLPVIFRSLKRLCE